MLKVGRKKKWAGAVGREEVGGGGNLTGFFASCCTACCLPAFEYLKTTLEGLQSDRATEEDEEEEKELP